MIRVTVPLIGIVAIFGMLGCFEEENSCNIRTPGIFVEYAVTQNGANANAEVVFWTGNDAGGTYLKLGACGDKISVNGVPLKKSGSNPIVYKANVETADSYDFVLERPNETPYVSTINNLPPPISILAPAGEDIARDEAFDVTWENNSAGKINLLISSDCFQEYPSQLGVDTMDNGKYATNAGEIAVVEGEIGNTCIAKVKLTRTIEGTLHNTLKGTFVGQTTAATTFTSSPAADETSQ